MNIVLRQTKRTDLSLLNLMSVHYSQPRGFVGRTIAYAIYCDRGYYGHIVAGSASRFLPGRNEFLGVDISQLNNVVNNVFFSVSPNGRYPTRNFTSKCVELFTGQVVVDWYKKYGDRVIGFETLVEPPRTGELYRRAGWSLVGETKGYTCKRVAGNGTDNWGGRRVWNTDPDKLRPKLVFCYKV